MKIDVSDEAQSQAIAAGYASLQEYVATLLDRDAERVAILQGIQAANEGRVQPFDEFDQEFRKRNGLDLSR
jgi:hypothetical protein